MRKQVMILLFALLAFAAAARGQGGTATRTRAASALPASCQPGGPNVAADTIIVNNIGYSCIQPGVWTFVPWYDVTQFGAVPAASNGYSTMTATCTATSQTLTSVSNDNYGTDYGFNVNGGVYLWGCGATNTLSTPGAPTVAPSGTWGLTETESPVTVANGSTTYSYKIIARDTGGGLTLPSTATTITTGVPIGLQTATISSISRTNDQMTVNLTGAPTSPLVVGDLINLYATSAPQFTGWYNVAVVNSSTQFVVYATEADTRAMGWLSGGDTTSYSGSGTVAFYRMNFLSWTPVTGAWEYYVCAERTTLGDTNYHLIGTTRPSSSVSGITDASFEDYGSPYNDVQTYPPYVQTNAEATFNNNATNIAAHTTSNAVCTAGAATNDNLSTYITAHDAGTGNYTIAVAATNSKTGTSGYYDNAPGIRRAIAASQTAPVNTVEGSYRSAIYFPPSSYPYLVQSFLTIPGNITVFQSGTITANDTIYSSANNINWIGDLGNSGAPQYAFTSGAAINAVYGTPAMYVTGSYFQMRNVTLASNTDLNGVVDMVTDSAASTFDHVNFSTASDSADYIGMNLIIRGTGSIAQIFFDKTSFNAGPSQSADISWTPGLWVAPGGGMSITMDHTAQFLRGVAIGGGGYGGACPFEGFTNKYSYRQAGIMPYFAIQNCPAYVTLRLEDTFQDTEGQPLLANLVSAPSVNVVGPRVFATNVTGGSGFPLTSGIRPSLLELNGSPMAYAKSIQNRDFTWDQSTLNGVFAPYDTSGSYVANPLKSIRILGMPMIGVGGYSWWFAGSLPSSVTATTSGSGSVPSGTYVYAVSSVGADFGETILSNVSASVSPNGSQGVAVTWANPAGTYSSNVWRCLVSTGNCTNADGSTNSDGVWIRVALHATGVAYTDTVASPGRQLAPQISGTGPTILNRTGAYSLLFQCPESAAPSPVSVADILYCDSTLHRGGLVNSDGTSGSAVVVDGGDNETTVVTGNLSATQLLASTQPTGFYFVTVYCEVTTGVASSTIITSIAYHDDTGAQTQSGVLFSGVTTGSVQSLTFPVRFVTGTALTYSTVTASSPQYKIFARVQAL